MDTSTQERKKVNIEVAGYKTIRKDKGITFAELEEWVREVRNSAKDGFADYINNVQVNFNTDAFEEDSEAELTLSCSYDREETEEEAQKREQEEIHQKGYWARENKERAWWELVQNLKSNPEFFDRIVEAMK